MTLTFEEASTGVTTKIKLPRQEYCEACNGTGAKKGTGVVACQTCGGRGQLAYQQGFFTITRTCPACQGAGQIDPGALPRLPRPGPHRARKNDRAAHSAGRRHRNAPARRRRRRARAQRRSSRRFVRRPRRQRAFVFRTPRRRSVLHDSDQHRAGDARHGAPGARA